jgi:ribonuclease PH
MWRGTPILDLDYPEDSTADSDMNIVMLADGGLIEVQGTAEEQVFSRSELNALLDLAEAAGVELNAAQLAVLATS